MKLLQKYILLSLVLSCAIQTQAQDKRRTKAYYDIESTFIDAIVAKNMGDIDKAIEIYKSVEKEPEAAAAVNYELSRIYSSQDKNEDAIKIAKKATQLEPENDWYQKNLAELYSKVNDDAAAATIFRQLAAKSPKNVHYHYKLAYFLVRSNKPDEALAVYENLEKTIGINSELTRRKHTLYLGLGDKRKAEQELLKLIKTYPDELEYRHFLAGFYKSIDQKNKANEVYEYIISKNPNDADAQIALANKKTATTNDADFVAALKPNFTNTNIAIDAKIAQILPIIQQVADENNKGLADKLLELSNILEEVHDDAKAYSIAGDLYFYTDRKDKAVEKYEKALERNETILLVWEQYLTALAETYNTKKLLDSSEEALDIFPNQGTIHVYNAIAYGRQGNHAQSLSALQQASMMAFKNPPLQYDIWTEMGEQYHFLKKYDKSDAFFQKAVELNPKGAKAIARYAYFLSKRKENMSEAKKMAEKAVSINPKDANNQAALAAVQFANNDYAKAVSTLAQAVAGTSYPNPRILEDYGDALFKNGDAVNAVIQWKKALDAGGSSSGLNKKISEKKL